MNLLTPVLQLIGSGATAYLLASQIRDAKTRPQVLAGFHLAEAGSVPYLTALRDRAAAEGDTWLAEQLTRHAQDERRHGQIFANALKQMGKEVIDLKTASGDSGDTHSSRSQDKGSPFFTAYYQGYSMADLAPDTIDWSMFFASTYILEADASHDFRLMAQALTGVPEMAKVQAGILSIAADEKGHASYLRQAMQRRYDFWTVEAVINQWRSRKVDALMAMIWNFVEQRGAMRPLVKDRVGETAIAETDTSAAVAIAA